MVVRCTPASDQARWVITFAPHEEASDLDRPGFGEQFFASRAISVIAVIGRGNDWYQYDDMADALAMIADTVAGSDRIVTYGSSMGGYAAIRFAAAVGAHATFALSPQYSIDRAKVPFETRWAQEAFATRWRPDIDGLIRAAGGAPIIVYDSTTADARHVARIRRDVPAIAIPLPYTGHPVTTFLASAGLLGPAILALVGGTFDPAAFAYAATAKRRDNPVHLGELAMRQPDHRARLGIALARRGLALAPSSDLMAHILAVRLRIAGRHEEAVAHHARAVRLANGLAAYALPYSEALATTGDIPAALRIAEDVVARHPALAHAHSWVAHLYWISGRRDEAVSHAARARTLAPRTRHFAFTHTSYMHHGTWRGRIEAWVVRIGTTMHRWWRARRRAPDPIDD